MPTGRNRVWAWRRALIIAALVATHAGCSVDTGFDGTQFLCSDGVCPEGFACMSGQCVAVAAGDGGAGDGSIDGAAPDARLLGCDEQFGSANAYQLCIEEPTSCEFYVQTDIATACSVICGDFGAECITSYDSSAGMECIREPEGNCDITHQTQLCVCARSPADS